MAENCKLPIKTYKVAVEGIDHMDGTVIMYKTFVKAYDIGQAWDDIRMQFPLATFTELHISEVKYYE